MRQLLRLCIRLCIFTVICQEWQVYSNRMSTDCFMTNLEDLNGASVSRQFLCHTYTYGVRELSLSFCSKVSSKTCHVRAMRNAPLRFLYDQIIVATKRVMINCTI